MSLNLWLIRIDAPFQPYLEYSTIFVFFLRLIALTDGDACAERFYYDFIKDFINMTHIFD